MNKNVAFIAFEEFDNLGIGYMSSILTEAGYNISVIEFRNGKEEILNELRESDPFIVGFALIFEYHIHEFVELIGYLREQGIESHFTAGGHYASLRYENVFELIPTLDSIVRFEGEYTFLDLANCVYSGTDFRNITGIVYNSGNTIIANPLRPVETDLDKFPFPMRSPLKEYAPGIKFATIIAGRGCLNNCSFCSSREYFKKSSGPFKRIRRPKKVVEEMELLHLLKGCSVFLFQDDDFPAKTQDGTEWIRNFCNELDRKNLTGKILLKINCRPDEVDYENFSMMKDHGLFLVFLGIEDGTDAGLSHLNKHMTSAKSLEGINILKSLEIDFDYGFMPFQPLSTYGSVRENFQFLRKICEKGFTSVTFLKLMPFYATAVERKLRRDGRLKIKNGSLDYDFTEESLNYYYDFISGCFMEWLRSPDGLLNVLKWSRNYVKVYGKLNGGIPALSLVQNEIRLVTDESNTYLLDTLLELAELFESGRYNNENLNYEQEINVKHDQFKKRIIQSISKLSILLEFHRQAGFLISME